MARDVGSDAARIFAERAQLRAFFQADVERCGSSRLHVDVFLLIPPEPWNVDRDVVSTRRQIRHAVLSAAIARSAARHLAIDTTHLHRDLRRYGANRIEYGASDRTR